jgi:hypothetical protein
MKGSGMNIKDFYVYRKQVIIFKWYVICLFETKNVLYVIWNFFREDGFELREEWLVFSWLYW